MRCHLPIQVLLVCPLVIVASVIVLESQFTITVNKDRLINAQNEPQNWLLMNGDYGSQRYSKLAQINRDNVENLRLVWALALGGMQDTGQNGPENEVNPLIDNGFMYTTDGWGTVYKIDARHPDKGEFIWITDPGVEHEGNRSRSRGIALWEELVVANLPDGRVIAIDRDTGEIVWDHEIAAVNEFGGREAFRAAPLVADGTVLIQNGSGDAGTRGWVAGLDVATGEERWRWYVVPEPGQPGSEFSLVGLAEIPPFIRIPGQQDQVHVLRQGKFHHLVQGKQEIGQPCGKSGVGINPSVVFHSDMKV